MTVFYPGPQTPGLWEVLFFMNLQKSNGSQEIKIDGRTLQLTRLDKVLYPKAGFTKGQVIDYYIQVGRCLLPHLKGRALTLKRYPDGVDKTFFYEKRCPSFRPKWMKTARIWSERQREEIQYCMADDLSSLVWAANLADLELHTSLARASKPGRPTAMVFDLDPGAPATILNCAQVALWLREKLEAFSLASFPKTTGSKGLQIFVPLNTAVTYERTKNLARSLAEELSEQHPQEVLFQMGKKIREGKVFIDWSQNDEHKTTVCVYSLRAKDQPTVSTPLRWKEVETACNRAKEDRLSFTSDEVLARVRKLGDLFEPVLNLKQKLPK
jgi:bifunctional non-homologous end joining protein LigD